MILQLAGGELLSGVVDVYQETRGEEDYRDARGDFARDGRGRSG